MIAFSLRCHKARHSSVKHHARACFLPQCRAKSAVMINKIFQTLSRTLALGLVAMGLSAALPKAVLAVESAWNDTDFASMRLIGAAASHRGATSDAPFVAGLEFELIDDWKIYWRAPGDAGFPPRIDWTAAENVANAAFRWPTPVRFSIFGLETLGYKNRVILPLDVVALDPNQPVRLHGTVDYLACSDICIPVTAALSMTIPPGDGTPSLHAQSIAQFDAQVPDAGTARGLSVDAITLNVTSAETGTGTLTVVARADPPLSDATDVFFDGPPGLAYGKPTLILSDDGIQAHLIASVDGLTYLDAPLLGANLTAVVVDGERAIDTTVTVTEHGPATMAPDNLDALSLWPILLLAVLGGLILNLMPCVLPVLSIKLLGVVGHGGGDRGRVRLHFLASAAGILTSFGILAAGLIALKSAGMAVGWGIQFQHPWFLVALSLVIVVFACNLFGFFEVRTPEPINAAGVAVGQHKGLRGDFFSGMLATVLATPCSAPFLGTAVGFALSAGAFEILAVFAALGLGLALPYLVVAAVPSVVTMLPKPGPWMNTLRTILGYALLATAVWLLWVLSSGVGWLATATTALFLCALCLLLWVKRRIGKNFQWPGYVTLVAAAVLTFAAPLLAPNPPSTVLMSASAEQGDSIAWMPFDLAAVKTRVAAGEVVFVDVTADWCITCKANKRLVLDRAPVVDLLAAPGVVAQQADWTRPNDAIAAYLASHNRYGIPFNVVYGPGAPDGITLPELLTPDAVTNALKAAANKG